MEPPIQEHEITYVDDEAKKSLVSIAHHVSLATNEKTGIPTIQPEIDKDVLTDPESEEVKHERPPGWAKFFPWFQKRTVHTTEASNFLKGEIGKIEETGAEVVLK